jgi:hypothetical protein
MKKAIAAAAFVFCFGVSAAHAQRVSGSSGVAGGGGTGPTSSGGGSTGGSGGGGSAIGSITHHPVWVPPPNVSAKNDGPFLPSTYQSFDKAVELGKTENETAAHQPSVVEVAKMTQEQHASASKSRFIVLQDVEGKLQEVKAQP